VGNTLLTPQVIARQALANLYETTVMAQLVHRDYEPEFAARVGDTITIRKPAVFEAKEFNRATGIEVQEAAEDSVDVTLNHFADVSFTVTSEDLTLTIEDFDEQLLTPAMEAIAQKIDRDLLALRDDITQTVGEATSAADGKYPWSDSRVLVQAGEVLNKRNVPTMDRRAVVGPSTQARWIAEDAWRLANQRGSTEGLTEARFGSRMSGFDPYMSQNVGQPKDTDDQVTGDPTTEVGIAFHRTALALAVRPLALPRGAADAAIVNYKGFGLRVIYDYDTEKKQDVVSIDCLYGCKVLDADRAVLIQGAPKA
jgi:hypothetical protein